MTDLLEEAGKGAARALEMEVAERCVAEATVRAGRAQPVVAFGAGNGVLDLVAGDFGWQVAQIFAPDLAPYLTAIDRGRHVWHCCLAAPERSPWTDPVSAAAGGQGKRLDRGCLLRLPAGA